MYIANKKQINLRSCSRRFSTIRRVERAIVIVGVLIDRVSIFALFFFSCFLSALGSLFFILDLLADGFDLLHVKSRSVLFTHESQFSSFTSHVCFFDAAFFLLLLLKHKQSLDFNVFFRLGPLASSICFLGHSGDAELDKGLEASEEPVINEFVKDDLELASGRIHLLSESVSQVQDDFDELKENNFSSLDVHKVLTDHLLSPVFDDLGHLRLFTRSSLFLINLWVVSDISSHLRASNDFLVNLNSFSSFLSSTDGFSFFDFCLSLSVSLLPSSDICVNGDEERVALNVGLELVLIEFITQSLSLGVILLNYLDEVFSLELLLIENVTLLEKVDELSHFESDVFLHAE